MGQKLYVGNISFQLDEDSLGDVFSAYGNVSSVKIVRDRETGRSRGFAFVEMESPDAAKDCIKNLDGKDVEGRNIRVSIAEEKERSGGGGGGGGRFRGGPGGGPRR